MLYKEKSHSQFFNWNWNNWNNWNWNKLEQHGSWNLKPYSSSTRTSSTMPFHYTRRGHNAQPWSSCNGNGNLKNSARKRMRYANYFVPLPSVQELMLTIDMKNILVSMMTCLMTVLLLFPTGVEAQPWSHGALKVSDNHRYLQYADGTPFFWLGDTGWLLPERLNREEVAQYLSACKANGYNVVQVQTVNGVPALNVYGASSHPNGYDFSTIDHQGYGYWQHMDYIIQTAQKNGIYVGMVCIWGGLVKSGKMDVEQAKAYGTFLANRYKDVPNIVWIIGGDVLGTVKTEVWETLACTIRGIDSNHLMTFHPRGRTSSATWFNEADWLDFNMFQSGHRRYGQRNGDGDYTIEEDTEEDNWRYVENEINPET